MIHFQFSVASSLALAYFTHVSSLLCCMCVACVQGDMLPLPYDQPYSNNFFKEAHVLLFCIVPLLIFNYIGALLDTDALYGQGNYVCSYAILCCWLCCVVLHASSHIKSLRCAVCFVMVVCG